MGNVQMPLGLGSAMDAAMAGGVVVVAQSQFLEPILAETRSSGLEGATFLPLQPHDSVPDYVIASARLLVIEIDPADRLSLQRLDRVRDVRSELPIIAALRETSLPVVRAMVRQGICDVAVLPFAPDELVPQILDVLAKQGAGAKEADLAPLTAVIRSTGGCGATTVVTHLAAALQQELVDGGEACILDLDMQCGDTASFLGGSAQLTLGDVLEAGARLDAEFLRSAVTASGRGFSIMAAPEEIRPLETVEVDHVLRLALLSRKQFAHVLVDLPADWTNWALSLVNAATDVLLVTDASIASLRQAKRRLAFLTSVGLPREKIRIVLNRVERRLFKSIGADEVADTLQCAVVASLAAEGAAMSAAQDQGLLITEMNKRSKFGADIRALAGLLRAEASRNR